MDDHRQQIAAWAPARRSAHRSPLAAHARRGMAVLALASAFTFAPTARAQDRAPASAPPQVSEAARREAAERYARGVQFYNEGDFKLALIEFERARSLVPNYKLLYNVGQVNQQLNNYARALEALTAYLEEGGDRVTGERRAAVLKDIAGLKARTALLRVTVSVPDAEIFLDDAPIGRSPLAAPVLVDAGVHKITASRGGYTAASSTVTLAGADVSAVTLTLRDETAAVVATRSPDLAAEAPPRPAEGRSLLWLGWVGTGVLAGGAAVTGVLAASRAGELADLRNADSTAAQRDAAASQSRTFGITTDVLAGCAIAAGLTTLYFTLTRDGAGRHKAAILKPAGRSVSLSVTF